jgi:hypothetical protein
VRGTIMRRLAQGLVAALVLLATACDKQATAAPGRDSQWPASAAGIVCQLLEYDAVTAKLGTRFDTAGGAKQDNTLTCALTQKDQASPYLTLALTPTTIDSVVFTESVKPQGAYSLPDLGVIAYRLTIPATGDVGPALQVVWLSESSRLIVLKYGFAPSTAPEEIDGFTAKMLALAQEVEKTLPS